MKNKINTITKIMALILSYSYLSACSEKKTSEQTQIMPKGAHSAEQIEVHSKANCPSGSSCAICDPSKREAGRLWCKEHGVYEDECYICHPEIKQKAKSKKSVKPHGSTHATEKKKNVLMCKEHGVPEGECAICHPDLAASLPAGQGLKIKLSTKNSAALAGIDVATPGTATVVPQVEAFCQIDYNQDRVTSITPMLAGVIDTLLVTPGKQVKKGELLATIRSTKLAELTFNYLAAISAEKKARLNFERKKLPALNKIVPQREIEKAEAEWNIAKVTYSGYHQQLINIGFTENELAALKISRQPTSQFSLRAPFAGTITKRDAALGQLAHVGDSLFTLVDLSTMWLELSIPSADAAHIALGMPVSATFESIPRKSFNANIIWIDTEIDPKTRLVHARGLIRNPPSTLRKGLFGQARIQLAAPKRLLTVPAAALQKINGIPMVFIKKGDMLYSATRVTLAAVANPESTIAIEQGISPTDQIVVTGSYIMRSEFLKSLLGAGCADD